jgi:hypothetical protein
MTQVELAQTSQLYLYQSIAYRMSRSVINYAALAYVIFPRGHSDIPKFQAKPHKNEQDSYLSKVSVEYAHGASKNAISLIPYEANP